MTVVKTHLKETKNKGIGLFASEFIPKGTIWWKDSPEFDKVITQTEYDSYPKLLQEFWNTYAFVQKNKTLYMCVDNARFINHSNNPNTGNIGNDCLTLNDIQVGEELTCNYRDICEWCKVDLGFTNTEDTL